MTEVFTCVNLMNEVTNTVVEGDTYTLTIRPEQEVVVKLSVMAKLESMTSSEQCGIEIFLLKREQSPLFDFVYYPRVSTSQTMTFRNDNTIRVYWMSESLNSDLTAIHVVANHYRNGRLVDTTTDEVKVRIREDARRQEGDTGLAAPR